MDLRTGCAFWLLKNGLLSSYLSLADDVTADVAVIGAGVTGAVVAYDLTRAGAKVVVVDRRDVASGSTAASTGLLLYETDQSLEQLAERFGSERAVRVYQLGRRAIDRIEELCDEIGDRCGFQRRSTLYLASTKPDAVAMAREYRLRVANGFDVQLLDARTVRARYGLQSYGALFSSGAGELDTYRFTHALLARAAAGGARVYSRTEVVGSVTNRDGVRLTTRGGNTIWAKLLIQAAGYELAEHKELRSYTSLHSTFACVTEPMRAFGGWQDRCLIWETARPYLYLRSTDDDRALIGGEDSRFSMRHRNERVLAVKRDRLLARFNAMFPAARARAAYAWGGVFAETRDGLPFIGARSGDDRTWYALGYGANGITLAVIGADLLRDRYLGRSNPDAALFAFSRRGARG